jgi:aromatic-L-amino-acid decarboxylase
MTRIPIMKHTRPTSPPDAEAMWREQANQRTKEVYEKINAKGDFFLTSTIVGGQYVIRVVSATLLSEGKYMKQLFDVLVQVAEA